MQGRRLPRAGCGQATGSKGDANDPVKDSPKSSLNLITGPGEHFFLGATINHRNVKYKDGSATPSEKPKELKIGLYYQPFGDVLSEYDNWNSPWESLSHLIVVQLSGELSKKPFNSGACGIGLRMPAIQGTFSFLRGLSITRGVMWSEAERAVGASKERIHQRDWVWMVGYDLTKVKTWFK